jgi:hypothetical protein
MFLGNSDKSSKNVRVADNPARGLSCVPHENKSRTLMLQIYDPLNQSIDGHNTKVKLCLYLIK